MYALLRQSLACKVLGSQGSGSRIGICTGATWVALEQPPWLASHGFPCAPRPRGIPEGWGPRTHQSPTSQPLARGCICCSQAPLSPPTALLGRGQDDEVTWAVQMGWSQVTSLASLRGVQDPCTCTRGPGPGHDQAGDPKPDRTQDSGCSLEAARADKLENSSWIYSF